MHLLLLNRLFIMNEIEMVVAIVLMTILIIIAALIITNISNSAKNASSVIDPNSAASVFDDFYLPRFRIGQIDTCQMAAGSVTTPVVTTCDCLPYGTSRASCGAGCSCFHNDDCISGSCEGVTDVAGTCAAAVGGSSGPGLKVNIEIISEEGITMEGNITIKSVPKGRITEYSEKKNIESGSNEFKYVLGETGSRPYYLSIEVRNKAGKLVIYKLEYVGLDINNCG